MAKKKKRDIEEVLEESPKEEAEPETKPDPEPESKPAEKPKVKAVPAEVPAPPKPLVSFQVFSQVSGIKWDQLAGFKFYAKKNGLGPLSIPDWKAALQEFLRKPTK